MKKTNTFKTVKLIVLAFLVTACSNDDDVDEQPVVASNDILLSGNMSTVEDAYFASATDVAVDQNGDVYVTDTNERLIKKISVADGSNTVTTIAGNNIAQSVDGVGTAASFFNPQTLTFNKDYTILYVGTWNKIRAIDMATMEVTTIAGSGNYGDADGIGANADFSFPKDIVLNNAGTTMYVSEHIGGVITAKRIRKIDLATQQVSTMSWNNLPDSFSPQQMIVDANDENLYLASTNVILKMNLQTNDVTILVGSSTEADTVDGIGEAARLRSVFSLAFSKNETYLYFTNGSGSGTRALRAVNMSTKEVTTVIASAGYNILDGAPGTAMFKDLKGMSFNSDGSKLYISDQYNNAIRVLE
ncbi:hypothetical protein [Lacinutrix algicola]|uniref:hypothetical protein n=1 Tax=Lacinutrix algicola TaxID=342954 RepID=UPI0006E26A80|nr:hypothetical protein [Lacinutrix algicola]